MAAVRVSVCLLVVSFLLAGLTCRPAQAVSLQPGWPQATRDAVYGGAALGDLDGDGDLEVVIGSTDGNVYAWHHDGVPVTGWPQNINNWSGQARYMGQVRGAVTLADLDGDGALEVLAGSRDYRVYAWHADGTLVAGWPQSTEGEVYNSPSVGDIDGDGEPEVVVGSLDHKVYAWHANGTLVNGWPQMTGGEVWAASSALADLDGDGRLKVVIPSQDGKVYVWHGDGTLVAGWPQECGGLPDNGCAVADVNRDGDLDVIAGSGSGVYVWHADGTLLPNWPQPSRHRRDVYGFRHSAPVVGDLHGDGYREIAAGAWDYDMFVWNRDGTWLTGWPQPVGDEIDSSPALADLDNDGLIEVIAASADYNVYAWHLDGTLVRGWPQATGWAVRCSPSVGDIDGDGHLEVVVGSDDCNVYVWKCDDVSGDSLPWPQFHHDAQHTGLYHNLVTVFYDVPIYFWSYAGVIACYNAGIVSGYGDGTYRPRVTVTRDQMAVYIARALAGGDAGVPPGPPTATFPDVPNTGYGPSGTDPYWAYKHVEYAVTQQIVGGYPDGHYYPLLPLDRGQMAVFIARGMAPIEERPTLPGYAPPDIPSFPDVVNTGAAAYWAYKEVEYIHAAGVAGGYPDGLYHPEIICTREQMAVFIARAFHLL